MSKIVLSAPQRLMYRLKGDLAKALNTNNELGEVDEMMEKQLFEDAIELDTEP